ncbi:hypothetical protein [aff. Roholtiella sp. LEGE 12411]|nr:hypothetical protein [aff. Roholtiella sp. LEGE 12411]
MFTTIVGHGLAHKAHKSIDAIAIVRVLCTSSLNKSSGGLGTGD